MSTSLYSGASGWALGFGLNGGITGLWGGNSGFVTGTGATLFLDFINGPLDPRITFSRNTTATRTNASGQLELVPSNVARSNTYVDYDPVTLTPRGALLERQSANLLLNSLLDGTSLLTQSVTVTAQAYTLTFYGTGSIALSGAYTGTLNGTGVYPTRTSLTFTPTAGTLTLTVTGTVQYAQLEVGTIFTSFIPTGAASVTRFADTMSMSGVNSANWYNPVAGTFLMVFQTEYTGNAPETSYLLALNGSGSQSLIYFDNGSNLPSNYDGTNILAALTGATGTLSKVVTSFDSTTKQIVANGSNVVSGPVAAGYSTATSLNIGSLGSSGNALNGWVKSLTFFPTNLSSAQKKALST